MDFGRSLLFPEFFLLFCSCMLDHTCWTPFFPTPTVICLSLLIYFIMDLISSYWFMARLEMGGFLRACLYIMGQFWCSKRKTTSSPLDSQSSASTIVYKKSAVLTNPLPAIFNLFTECWSHLCAISRKNNTMLVDLKQTIRAAQEYVSLQHFFTNNPNTDVWCYL